MIVKKRLNIRLALLGVALLGGLPWAALLKGGDWFEPMGPAQTCIVDPGQVCPDDPAGPSEVEKALGGNGYSRLQLSQNQGEEWNWEGGSARTGHADMDFDLLVTTPLRSVVGFALRSPWPAQEWRRGADSVRMYQVQPYSSLSALLGWDLLGLGESEGGQQLLLAAELPIAYEPGVWKGSLSYLPTENYRLRVEYAQVKPRQEMAHWENNEDVFKLKYTERRLQGQLAGRFAWGPEWAGTVSYSKLEASDAPALTRDGHIWGAAGHLAWLGPTWSLRNDFTAEYRDLQHRYGSPAGDGFLLLDGVYDLYDFRTRLQRTFARTVRIGLQSERRLAKESAGNSVLQVPVDSLDWLRALDFSGAGPVGSRMQSSLYGGDVRWWFAGLYLEAGGDYALSRWSGQSSPLFTWGDVLDLQTATATESAVLRLGAGFQVPGALYSYSFRKAYDLGPKNATLKRGAMHSFEIAGSF